MNKNKTLAVVVTVLSAFLTAISAYSGEDEESLLTLGEVKCVWNGQYKSGHDKSCAVIKIMDRMRHERRRGTNLVEAVVIEKYLLDEISRTKAASTVDYDSRAISGFYDLGFYLMRMSEWDCMKDEDGLMKVASTLARFQPLPDLEATKASDLAWQVDTCMKYGTNRPPKRFGLAGNWYGPTTELVYRMIGFRKDYNHDVAKLHRDVLERYKKVIFEERDKSRDEASRQALWEEFVRVSGVKPEE